MRFRVCYANCAKWEKQKDRWPDLIDLLVKQRASLYILTEAPDELAWLLAHARGWARTRGDVCWVTAPNRNTVVWAPRKYWFRQGDTTALSEHEGDVADGKNRTAAWALLQRRSLLPSRHHQLWLGASHLSPNAGRTQAAGNAQRVSQATALVGSLPGTPLLLGIDRNCNPPADPARVLAQALDFLTPGLGDTFTAPGVQDLDGIYGSGVAIRWLRKVWPGSATDHAVLRFGITINEGTSSL